MNISLCEEGRVRQEMKEEGEINQKRGGKESDERE